MNLSEHEFLTLAKKFAYHDPYECTETDCMVCEALGIVINSQSDIEHAYFERGRDNADLDAEGIPF